MVFLSAPSGASDGAEPITRRAYGVIPRDAAPNSLLRFLRRISSGLELSIPKLANKHGCRPGGSTESLSTVLTERERQIVHLVSTGQSNKEIARRLNLTEGTVKVHLHHIFQKLAINNRTALAALAALAAPSIKELF